MKADLILKIKLYKILGKLSQNKKLSTFLAKIIILMAQNPLLRTYDPQILLKSQKFLWRFFSDWFQSQIGQDQWVIFHTLPFKRKGFFLDLAAADGVFLSNTYVLEKLFGWKGICIEPNPIFLKKLKKNRRCIIDDSIVNDKSDQVDFRIDSGLFGGIIADDTANNYKNYGGHMKQAEIITTTACTLTEVLDRLNAPKIIDYFSLDVEGAEARVIKGLDFNKYRFNCLTIEAPQLEVYQILLKNGYIFIKNIEHDACYVHKTLLTKSKIKCEPFKLIPRVYRAPKPEHYGY